LKYTGFSVAGVDWTDLSTATSNQERLERLKTIGREEARLTHEVGGNLLRVFFSFPSLLAEIAPGPLLPGREFLPRTHDQAWHLLTDSEKVVALDAVSATLSTVLDAIVPLPPNGEGLAFADLDAYLAGVRAFNATRQDRRTVQVLLTLVALPPVQILESPSKDQLGHFGRDFTFETLWARYIDIFVRLWRMVVRRYSVEPGEDRVVCAFEINNEPDSEWLPDELRIEKGQDKSAYPLSKYITELHYPQIPETQTVVPPFERTIWGGFKDQRGPWSDEATRPKVPLIAFDWGEKFDWYVRCYAELAEHMSFAIMQETRDAGINDVDIVSAGVTHNNIDYLMRMYRANPRAFAYCTAIGLHPYHCPEHNIHDKKFRSPYDLSQWRSATPRQFARQYFKRFDFFKEAARLTRLSGPDSFGLEGKKIWLTEFGIPSKVIGAYNADKAQFVPLIRPRSLPPEALPFKSEVWEDLWDAFFDQISPSDLEAANCEVLAFSTLRETAIPSFDRHDDDRSNFALIRRDGSPRMDPQTFSRFRSFLDAAHGRKSHAAVPFPAMPLWARGKSHSIALLRARPWEYLSAPPEALNTISMLTEDEKRFLYWCTLRFYDNKGEIVELGPFAGGSSVALAAGLRASWPEANRTVQVYDRFKTDEFIDNFYLKPNGLAADSGSFRHVYDKQTAAFSDLLRVHEGDVTQELWNGAPIEILFIDIAKAWHVNDHVNRTFLPHLIPGKSLVIQQDFFHQWEYWTILTMELLKDYFEYVGFVRWNSAVYQCVRAIPVDVIPRNLRALGLDRLRELLAAQIARHQEPYLRGMLQTAMVGLLRDFHAYEEAAEVARRTASEFPDQPFVKEAIEQFGLAGIGSHT
jgi:hypothetical protein